MGMWKQEHYSCLNTEERIGRKGGYDRIEKSSGDEECGGWLNDVFMWTH